MSYIGAAYSLAPGDYLIIRHNVAYMPDLVYTISGSTLVTQSSTALTSASNNGDWYYDNSTNLFTYIGNKIFWISLLILFFTINLVKNPSTNTNTMDVPINLNVIKCRYPNCEPPAQPGLELPATARPATALYWSNDSDWAFALPGYGGYGKII